MSVWGMVFYEGKPKVNKGFFLKFCLIIKFLHKIGELGGENRIGLGIVFLQKWNFGRFISQKFCLIIKFLHKIGLLGGENSIGFGIVFL